MSRRLASFLKEIIALILLVEIGIRVAGEVYIAGLHLSLFYVAVMHQSIIGEVLMCFVMNFIDYCFNLNCFHVNATIAWYFFLI